MGCTIFIVGDSTAALKGASEKPMSGWAEYLSNYLDPEIRIDNRAINGRSTKSFLAEGRLAAIEEELQKGDFLFIQFGHNDGKLEDSSRYTGPEQEYPNLLRRFITAARRREAVPVLLTSVSRRRFLADHTLDRETVGPYPEVMRKTAIDTGTPLLDIYAASQQLFRSLGDVGSRPLVMHLPKGVHPNYPEGITDDTHFSEAGARQIARLVAEALSHSASPELAPLRSKLRLARTDKWTSISEPAPPLNLGVRAHDFGQLPLNELISRIKHYGFSCIQFAPAKSFPESVPSLSALSSGTAAYYGSAFREAGINLTVLGCYVNIVHSDLNQQKKALADFSTCLRLARDFGTGLVGTETGSVGRGYTPDNFTEDAYQTAANSVKYMVEQASLFGVTVGIEAGLNHPIHSAKLLRRLLDEVSSPNLQVILDCANLMSPDNYTCQEEVVADAFELLGDRIAVIHLKDFTVKQGQIIIVPAGRGLLDFRPILRYLKYNRPHLQALLESTPEPFMEESIGLLRKLYLEV